MNRNRGRALAMIALSWILWNQHTFAGEVNWTPNERFGSRGECLAGARAAADRALTNLRGTVKRAENRVHLPRGGVLAFECLPAGRDPKSK